MSEDVNTDDVPLPQLPISTISPPNANPFTSHLLHQPTLSLDRAQSSRPFDPNGSITRGARGEVAA